MTYTKISLYLANGIPEALSNLWYGSDSAVVEIRDAVEDAKNGKDLLNRIQKMKLLRKFTLEVFSFVRSDHRSGAGCLLVPHHPHRLHGREDQLRSDPENHHSERQAQLLHSLCAEHPQGQQQAAG